MGVYVDIYAEYNSPKSGKSGEWHAVPLFLKDIDQGEDERLKLAFLHAGQGMTEMHITSLPDDVLWDTAGTRIERSVRGCFAGMHGILRDRHLAFAFLCKC